MKLPPRRVLALPPCRTSNDDDLIEIFVERGQGREGAQERANYVMFLNELCQTLDLPMPDPAGATREDNDYVFERAVRHFLPDGSAASRRINLYKRNGFVLEAKRFRLKGQLKAPYFRSALIYATCFEVGADSTHTNGRGGRSLGGKWKHGVETMHSMFTRGFPNCFVVSTMQSGKSANFQHMLDEKARHIAFLIGEQRRKAFEPSENAEKEWVDTIVRLAIGLRAFLSECTLGCYNTRAANSMSGLPRIISTSGGRCNS